MTKYDNTDEKKRSKWVLRDNWQSNFRYSSKNDIIKTEKCFTEKGVYRPYDYMNAFDKFNDEQLPSKEQFYSRLTGETTPRQSKYGNILISRTWVNIMICI